MYYRHFKRLNNGLQRSLKGTHRLVEGPKMHGYVTHVLNLRHFWNCAHISKKIVIKKIQKCAHVIFFKKIQKKNKT